MDLHLTGRTVRLVLLAAAAFSQLACNEDTVTAPDTSAETMSPPSQTASARSVGKKRPTAPEPAPTEPAPSEPSPTEPAPTPSGSFRVWIDGGRLAALPTSGTAWSGLKAAADKSCGTPALNDQNSSTNVCIMAKALVFARTNQSSYRTPVVEAIRTIVNSGTYRGRALALGRELGAYVIAADLVGLASYDATLDNSFRQKLLQLRTTYTDSGPANLVECHEERPNNWGTHCGASRAAIAAYVGDRAELDRIALVFRGWLGDRSAYTGFRWDSDLSWQCNPTAPVAINPSGCTRYGVSLDGVLPEDQRRGGSFRWPAPKEPYVYEALQGAVAQAAILQRQGYAAFDWSDKALLRAFRWLNVTNGFPAEADDTWQPHVINHFYGTSYYAPLPARAGKNVGWTDWTH